MSHEHTIDVLRELGNVLKGSTYPERMALLVLQEAGEPVPIGYLAQRIGMSRGATTSIVDRLQAGKYAKRVYDEKDRRRVDVELKAPGRHAIERATTLAQVAAA